MKTILVSWTYLDVIEVDDDMTFEEIDELLDDMEPLRGTFNDREWFYADGTKGGR